jgi:hypothetical protein
MAALGAQHQAAELARGLSAQARANGSLADRVDPLRLERLAAENGRLLQELAAV